MASHDRRSRFLFPQLKKLTRIEKTKKVCWRVSCFGQGVRKIAFSSSGFIIKRKTMLVFAVSKNKQNRPVPASHFDTFTQKGL